MESEQVTSNDSNLLKAPKKEAKDLNNPAPDDVRWFTFEHDHHPSLYPLLSHLYMPLVWIYVAFKVQHDSIRYNICIKSIVL